MPVCRGVGGGPAGCVTTWSGSGAAGSRLGTTASSNARGGSSTLVDASEVEMFPHGPPEPAEPYRTRSAERTRMARGIMVYPDVTSRGEPLRVSKVRPIGEVPGARTIRRSTLRLQPMRPVESDAPVNPAGVRHCAHHDEHVVDVVCFDGARSHRRGEPLPSSSSVPSSSASPFKTSRSLDAPSTPTLSTNPVRSIVRICETLTTLARGRPASPRLRRIFPGMTPSLRFDVIATTTVVGMALLLNRSCCTTRAGRRPAGAESTAWPN